MHRQLPLNIISQFIDINQIDYNEITKILKNTLVDKGMLFIEVNFTFLNALIIDFRNK